MKSLYSKIFSLTMPQFDRVQDSRLRSEARRSMCVLIANAHKTVFDMATDSKSGRRDPMSHCDSQSVSCPYIIGCGLIN